MNVKRIFFVIFALVFSMSCSDDDSSGYHYELLPVSDAVVPEEFQYGEIYTLAVKYIVPDNCYFNSDILYEYDGTARNIAVLSLVLEYDDCDPLDVEDELAIRVHALQTSPYVFRFWQGEDANGEPVYLIKEVPVIQNAERSPDEFKATHIEM